MTPIISVIIPIYNMHQYISQCLDSIVNQTLQPIEIICIDDGSDDGSLEILYDYAKNHDNISVICQNREGPGVARNKGIEAAKGEYVCFMDADDYYPSKDVLQTLYSTAKEQNVEVCGGNISNLYPDGHVEDDPGNFTRYGFLNTLEHPRIYGQTRFIYKRQLLWDNNLRYLPYIRFEDPPFVLETLLAAGNYYTISDAVYIRRVTDKVIRTSREIAAGILKGVLRCYQLAAEHDLKELYLRELEQLLDINIEYLCPYLRDGENELWDDIHAINSYAAEFDPDRKSFFSDYDSFKSFVRSIEKPVCKIKDAKQVVIYGAGITAKRLLDSGYVSIDSIIGFATTDIPNDTEFEGYFVKQINEYIDLKGTVLLIIAAGDKINKDMDKTADKLGFKNRIIVTNYSLDLAKSVMKL